MAKLAIGINDLALLSPEVVAEADSWDLSKVLAGSHTSMNWKYTQVHEWDSTVLNRTSK